MTDSPTIIEVPVTKIRVGDIVCAIGQKNGTGIVWEPHMTVTAITTPDGCPPGWRHWETTITSDYGDYVDEMAVLDDWTFHIVARSIGDELIGRGKS